MCGEQLLHDIRTQFPATFSRASTLFAPSDPRVFVSDASSHCNLSPRSAESCCGGIRGPLDTVMHDMIMLLFYLVLCFVNFFQRFASPHKHSRSFHTSSAFKVVGYCRHKNLSRVLLALHFICI
mmetsp:Transcript_64469/g.107984  ORF Transcript_64469/g.107984 Transcript_64469/m.107984 type:complete len:124 (+) Transcript_64469:277-648(+)